MNLRNISAWSTRNPVVPLVLFAALLFAGLLSFNRMDVVNNPDVEFPAVSVNISQPGAAPTEIENQITQRVKSAGRCRMVFWSHKYPKSTLWAARSPILLSRPMT